MIKETKWFLSKASSFVFWISIISYLLLFLLNVITDDFVSIFFKIHIPLAIAVASGLFFVLTYDYQNDKLNEN